MVGSDLSKFPLSDAIVQIDVLLGKISHNPQANNCMTSPRGMLSCSSLLYRFNSSCYLYSLQRRT